MMQQSVEDLVRENAGLVRPIALRIASRLAANIEIDDMIQAGMEGLLDAARRYKVDPGAKFSTYATARINGAIIDEVRRQDWLPRTARAKGKKIEKAIQKAGHAVGRAPNESEIAEAMGVTLEEYQASLGEAHSLQVFHFEDLHPEEGDGATFDFLDFAHSDSIVGSGIDSDLVRQEFQSALARAIAELPEREKLVLSLAFEQDLNVKEIAEVMEVTPSRISQLRAQAVTRLRAALAREQWTPEDMEDAGAGVGN